MNAYNKKVPAFLKSGTSSIIIKSILTLQSHQSLKSPTIPVSVESIAPQESYILRCANRFASLSFPANDCWSRIDTHCCWLMHQITIGYKRQTYLPSIVSVDDQINGRLKELYRCYTSLK